VEFIDDPGLIGGPARGGARRNIGAGDGPPSGQGAKTAEAPPEGAALPWRGRPGPCLTGRKQQDGSWPDQSAGGSRTTLPNCSPASRMRGASAAPWSVSTACTAGRRRPASTQGKSSSSSPLPPM